MRASTKRLELLPVPIKGNGEISYAANQLRVWEVWLPSSLQAENHTFSLQIVYEGHLTASGKPVYYTFHTKHLSQEEAALRSSDTVPPGFPLETLPLTVPTSAEQS